MAFIVGTARSDTLIGTGERDELRGGEGNDDLRGGDRYDVLIGGIGNDLLNGGPGFDLAAYWYDPAAIVVNLQAGTVTDGHGTVDTLVEIDAVFGSVFADTFAGSEAGDIMVGLDGNDAMRGLGGADLMEGGAGDDTVDGGAGVDVFVVSAGKRAGQVAVAADGAMTLTAGSLGTDRLTGVEEIRFLDGRMVYNADDPAMRVARLYEAALDRAPDQGGLENWTSLLQSGTAPLVALAEGFLGSAEFRERFGGNLDNGAFVDRLYQNVLGRQADAAGRDAWLDGMANGISRAEVLGRFSESAENRAGTAGLAAAGVWDADEGMAVLARLYHSALDRRPDAGGFELWKDALEDRELGMTIRDVARGFIGSDEFRNTYGSLNDRDYADRLYRNVLGREGDAAGLDAWEAALRGGRSREDVLLGFSESAEHVALTSAVVLGTGGADLGIAFA